MGCINEALKRLEKASSLNNNEYAAYIHGQIYGMASALKVLFPGPGNWGEKAALKVRPVLTEHRCDDYDHN